MAEELGDYWSVGLGCGDCGYGCGVGGVCCGVAVERGTYEERGGEEETVTVRVWVSKQGKARRGNAGTRRGGQSREESNSLGKCGVYGMI